MNKVSLLLTPISPRLALSFLITILCLEATSQAQFSPAVAPTNGLVAWWKAEGNADDALGNHNGQIVSGVTFLPGVFGKAFNFSGIGKSGIVVPDGPDFQLTNSLTLEGWIKVSASSDGMILFRGDDRPGLDPYYLSINKTNGTVRFHIESETAATNLEAHISLDSFVHVAATLEDTSGTMRLFLNGKQAASVTTPIRPSLTWGPVKTAPLGLEITTLRRLCHFELRSRER